ncbi:AAA family ATPase [Actinorhabdospora filicis]|uniref:AAA family ATPase n=1 Tax=Actinorhabdospora filicis TaxID=1785913 RepID=UPI002555DFA2|nr:ATP-binding protein [Actinorhabdospora filicis]
MTRSDIPDREPARRLLAGFTTDSLPHASLGLLSGRRRIGKTTLARQTGGLLHTATDAGHRASLEKLRGDLAAHLGAPPPDFGTWPQALDVLLALGRDRAFTVVIDDTAELYRSENRILDQVAAAFDPARPEVAESRTRLLLSGSAATHFGEPLLRHKPLRERAVLDLRLEPLGYRAAAEWWGVGDPAVAMPLYAILGGTPVHRDLAGPPPLSAADIRDFCRRTVLEPSHELFDIAIRFMRDEIGPTDIGWYRTIPFTMAFGTASLLELAKHFAVEPVELRRHLATLVACGLAEKRANLLSPGDVLFRIAEPLLTFYHAMMRTDLGRLRRGYIHDFLWERRASRFSEMVLNPQWAAICREWAAGTDRFGEAVHVGRGYVRDPENMRPVSADVMVLGEPVDGGRPRLLAAGLCRWDAPVTAGDAATLRRAVELGAGRYDVSATRLLAFTGPGVESVPGLEIVTAGTVYEL